MYRGNKNYNIIEQKIGILNTIYYKMDGFTYVKKINAYPLLLAVILIPIFLVPMMQVKAASYQKEALTIAKAGSLDDAANLNNKAISLDPFNPIYRLNHAKVLTSKQTLSTADKVLVDREMESAEKLSINNADLLTDIGRYHFQIGNLEKGFEVFERAIKLKPFDPKSWENLIDANRQLYEIYSTKGQNNEADKYFEKTLSVVKWAKEVNKKNLDPFIFNSKTSEYLERVMYLKDNIQNREKAVKSNVVLYNIPYLDINQDTIPDQWTPSTRDGIRIEYDSNKMVIENMKPEQYNYIQSRVLSLIPGKSYRIEVELTSSQSMKTIPFFVSGVSRQDDELIPQGNGYIGDISVPADLKLDNPNIVLYVMGKYEIVSFKITEK
jgi:tetratricopeptide (TPR) repeat protein